MLEAVGSIYYLFNDLVFFLALFVVQTIMLEFPPLLTLG